MFFTINKWLALGLHEGNEHNVKDINKTKNINNYYSDNDKRETDL